MSSAQVEPPPGKLLWEGTGLSGAPTAVTTAHDLPGVWTLAPGRGRWVLENDPRACFEAMRKATIAEHHRAGALAAQAVTHVAAGVERGTLAAYLSCAVKLADGRIFFTEDGVTWRPGTDCGSEWSALANIIGAIQPQLQPVPAPPERARWTGTATVERDEGPLTFPWTVELHPEAGFPIPFMLVRGRWHTPSDDTPERVAIFAAWGIALAKRVDQAVGLLDEVVRGDITTKTKAVEACANAHEALTKPAREGT